jgi:2'-5' RNA ligase
MLRLFFALQPSAELGARLMGEAAVLFTQLETQPVPAGNLHATLCFVGAVAEERLDALRDAAATVRNAPVTLEFGEFDFWTKPRVLVASASQESASAVTLSRALHAAAVGAGFAPDEKPFRAHLTLARKISPTLVKKISWPQKISPGFVVRCDRFVLMQSRRGEHGSIYSVVDEWTLDAKEGC